MKNPLSGTHSDPSSNLICLGSGLEGLFWLDKAPIKGLLHCFSEICRDARTLSGAELAKSVCSNFNFLDYKKQKE